MFFSLLKSEGIYIQKDVRYKIIDSLEVKGRSQGDFHQLRISLRSVCPTPTMPGEVDTVGIVKHFSRKSG